MRNIKHYIITIGLVFLVVFQFCINKIESNKPVETITITDTIYIDYKLTEWQLFTLALIDVESEYDTLAVNKNSKARGILQIMPIFVKEANRLQDTTKYEWSDAYYVDKSLEMFNIINPEQDIDLAIRRHNPNAGAWYSSRIKNRMDKFRLIFKIKEKI